jgi:DMSO/TMAO reductase YedYZ heme-binding membrane subunit
MIAVTSPYLWYTTRATGVVALLLFTASMVLGVLTTTRVQSATVPRFAVSELHRRISLLAVVFLGIHIASTAVDSFVPIGWWPVLVPFTSAYQPLWVGLGTVAFDLLIAVTLTSLVRRRLGAGTWRAVHWLAYLSWPLAMAHAAGVGTDMRFTWLDALVALCAAAVLAAVAWRLYAHPHPEGHRTAVPESAQRVIGRDPALAPPERALGPGRPGPVTANGRPVAGTGVRSRRP